MNCGEPRFSAQDIGLINAGVMAADVWQLYLVRDDGNKTVVSMCEKCYGLPGYDYEKLRDNLAASEIDFARAKGLDASCREHAEGFKSLKFVGHTKSR